MSQRRLIGTAALAVMALLGSSCADEPERRDALPPACSGSDDPAYAYSTANDSNINIFGVRPDGDVVALTTDGGSGSPSFSPDGVSIYFTRAAPGLPGASSPRSADSVWVMSADGSDPTELLRMTEAVSVSVSPDGTQLAVIGRQPNDGDRNVVYVADIDGGALRRLYEPPGSQLLFPDVPAWSPDGSELAVDVTSGTQFAVYAVSVSAGSAREVTQSASVSHLLVR